MKKEYLLAAYTIFCWGTLPAVTKLTLTNISNMQVLFISSAIATIVLFIYLCYSGKIRMVPHLSRKDLIQLVALGFLGNFLYSAFYYAGVRTLSSADASVINYLWPIIASVCASFVLHEKIAIRGWIAILVSFAGVLIISTKGHGLHIADYQGVAYCIAGAVCYGIFNVFNKRKGLDQYLCTAIYFAVTMLFSGIIFAATERFSFMPAKTWAGIIWLGVFIDAIAILTWGLAIQKADVSYLSNFAYATPVVATLISYVLLQEPVERYTVLGMVFVLFGCILQIMGKRGQPHYESEQDSSELRRYTCDSEK